jgi:hypothetical protein
MAETKPLLLASASLIGIFVIGFCADLCEVGFTDLEDIDSGYRNQVVHVRGFVKEFRGFSAGVKLLLEQDGHMISVVYFGESVGKKGMCADVVGEVKTKEGAIEISASSLSLFIC